MRTGAEISWIMLYDYVGIHRVSAQLRACVIEGEQRAIKNDASPKSAKGVQVSGARFEESDAASIIEE